MVRWRRRSLRWIPHPAEPGLDGLQTRSALVQLRQELLGFALEAVAEADAADLAEARAEVGKDLYEEIDGVDGACC